MIDMTNVNSTDNFFLSTYGLLASLTGNGTRLVQPAHREAFKRISEAARNQLWFDNPISMDEANLITDKLGVQSGYSNDPLVRLMWLFTDALFITPGAPDEALTTILAELTMLSTQVVQHLEELPCLTKTYIVRLMEMTTFAA